MADDTGDKLNPAGTAAFAKSMAEAGMIAAEIVKAIQSMNAEMTELVNKVGKQSASLKEQAETIKEARDLARERGQLARNSYIDQENQAASLRNEADLHRDVNNQLTERGKEMKRQANLIDDNNEAAQNSADLTVGAAQTLTGISDSWKNTTIGGFFQGDFENNLARNAEALMDNFSAANMLGSSLMKVQEATMMMVVSADAQFANINKLTGTQGEYNDMIMLIFGKYLLLRMLLNPLVLCMRA